MKWPNRRYNHFAGTGTGMAIRADDIDEARAEEAHQRAGVRLAQKITDEEGARIQAVLAHAAVQLKVKRQRRK